jgi:hypothetical protein
VKARAFAPRQESRPAPERWPAHSRCPAKEQRMAEWCDRGTVSQWLQGLDEALLSVGPAGGAEKVSGEASHHLPNFFKH